MITNKEIEDLVSAARFAGFSLDINDIKLEYLKAGIETHKPKSLPLRTMGAYIFKYSNTYLKVGYAGSNSNARYQSHHYSANSSSSNLALSLLTDPTFKIIIKEQNLGMWIKSNTDRFNILIPASIGMPFLRFVESYFILKCQPKFGG